jgi:hypothetical protein
MEERFELSEEEVGVGVESGSRYVLAGAGYISIPY